MHKPLPASLRRLATRTHAPRTSALEANGADAILLWVRQHARRVLKDVNDIQRHHPPPEQQAWLDEARRRVEMILRLTDREGGAAIARAIRHADLDLTLAQVIAALMNLPR